MKKSILTISMTVMLGACGDPAPREVNNENCETEAILQWAEENNLTKEQMWEFSRKCSQFIHSLQTFERSEDKGWKF